MKVLHIQTKRFQDNMIYFPIKVDHNDHKIIEEMREVKKFWTWKDIPIFVGAIVLGYILAIAIFSL